MIRVSIFAGIAFLCLGATGWTGVSDAAATDSADNDLQWRYAVKRSQSESSRSANGPMILLAAKNTAEQKMLAMQLRSDSYAEKRYAAMTIHRSYLHNRLLQKAVEKELLKGYKIRSRNKGFADALAWMCNVLGDSGNPKYAATLERVSSGAKSRKVRRFAKRNYRKVR